MALTLPRRLIDCDPIIQRRFESGEGVRIQYECDTPLFAPAPSVGGSMTLQTWLLPSCLTPLHVFPG